jgi:hypothetical protein
MCVHWARLYRIKYTHHSGRFIYFFKTMTEKSSNQDKIKMLKNKTDIQKQQIMDIDSTQKQL